MVVSWVSSRCAFRSPMEMIPRRRSSLSTTGRWRIRRVIITVRALASFDIVKVLTDGGPITATQVLSHLLYQEAFQFFDTGYASAVAVVFFALVLLLALLQMKVERWVHYQ